ncbi:MAG TPA: flotillin domain-containing protein, partial [Thiobacillus sp.]|nr:flotillin domain-containing protein [Thiobacillus sp.]
ATTGGNLAEQAVSAALAYRAQQPLIDSLLSEVGLKEGLSVRVGESLFAATAPVQAEIEPEFEG